MSDDHELHGWFPDVVSPDFILRPSRHDDAADLLAIHSRMDVVKWLDNPPVVLMETEAQARELVDRRTAKEAIDPLQAQRSIVDRATGTVVGGVGVSHVARVDGTDLGEYELGWHLHPDAAGRGLATSAARVLADQAFTAGLPELVIGMYPDNEPSAAVARRLGAEDLGIGPDLWYGGDGHNFRLRPEHLVRVATERLVLRRCTRHDLDVLADLFAIPEVARWSGDGRPRSRELVRQQIADQPGRAGPHSATAVVAICLRRVDGSAGEVVGVAMLVPLPASAGSPRRDVEIGWHLHPDAQGHGYATEAAQGLIARAASFGVTEVVAVTHPDNVASQAVCRRLGMTDLGLRDDWYDRTLRAFSRSTSS